MAGLLAGLAKLGLGSLEGLEVFEPEETSKAEKVAEAPVVKKEPTEADYLFDRKYICPICNAPVVSKAVRSGRVKMIGTDLDLRPRYQQMDTLKYDIVACRICGYAALGRNFANVTEEQSLLIQSKITATFKSQAEIKNAVYSYDDALERYKLALANAIVKQDKASERAYLCLKTAWVVRGKRELLEKEAPDQEKAIAELTQEEKLFLKNALEGFLGARQKERFPMCGMDELTVDYLIAALATVFEQYETANKLIGNILVSRVANERLKDKARDLKEVINKK